MRADASALAFVVAASAATLACSGVRPPSPAEVTPISVARAPRAALPDDMERAAGRLAALVYANATDTAATVLSAMQEEEETRRRRGEPPTGLLDNARHLYGAAAGSGEIHYWLAEQLLEEASLDPALRKRLEREREGHPLRLAEQRLAEERRYRYGSLFNRTVAPLSRLLLRAPLDPIGATHATLSSYAAWKRFPTASPRERQALRAYEDYLAANPDAPERSAIEARIHELRRKRSRHLHEKTVAAARKALEAGSAEMALAHLDRADRLHAPDARTRALRERANASLQEQRRQRDVALSARDVVGLPLVASAETQLAALARDVLVAPLGEVAERANAWRQARGEDRLSDEMELLASFGALGADDEDGWIAALEALVRSGGGNMARHAAALVSSPDANPYARYREASSQTRRASTRWVAQGAPRRPSGVFPRPVDAILSIPRRVVGLATSPLRLLRYSRTRVASSQGVIDAGERYLARRPRGAHADEVRAELEDLYTRSGRWMQALEHHQQRRPPDPERIAMYRERIAEGLLAAAKHPERYRHRIDVRIALLRAIELDYADTRALAPARALLVEILRTEAPQRIRISREYLREHPELWAPGALGLRAELLDAERGNGEIAEEGITLLGGTSVEIALEDREPVRERIPEEAFARFAALLEESRYQRLATDDREGVEPDPQRDRFLEEARLGIADARDPRPTARSTAVYLGTHEKHGFVRRRESILPVEFVVQGDFEGLGFSAFPRILLPRETPDAVLYE